MSTSNTPTEDPAVNDTCSVGESVGFVDAILSNPLLLTTLRAEEILQLKRVCKLWREWFAYRIRYIAAVREEDDTHDWYFPVLVNVKPQVSGLQTSWSSWFGIWHERADHASEKLHSLPVPLLSGDILAGSGGLLLMKITMPLALSSSRAQSDWEPLVVGNPLTKEFRELPAADCADVGVTSWKFSCSVQVHMVVDDEANTYRVILTFPAFVCVYNSASNSWKSLRFPNPGPWGGRNRTFDYPWAAHVCASVYSCGRLHFAHIELGSIVHAPGQWIFRLRVFEVDFETGVWNSHTRDVPPQTWRHNFEHCPLYDIMTSGMVGFVYRDVGIVLPYFELVECMGEIYAVVPTRLDESLEMGATALQQTRPEYYESVRHHFNAEFEYMPLQFYIFQLEGPSPGESLVHGALRIQLPCSTSDIQSRRESLSQIFHNLEDHSPYWHWFSCTARGSVIWVSCEDYLLQYDVVSGQSKMQIIQDVNGNDDKQLLKFSYRPSVHMKP